jgi:hypothetical protein
MYHLSCNRSAKNPPNSDRSLNTQNHDRLSKKTNSDRPLNPKHHDRFSQKIKQRSPPPQHLNITIATSSKSNSATFLEIFY